MFKLVMLFLIFFQLTKLYVTHNIISAGMALEGIVLYVYSGYSTKWKIVLFPFLICWVVQLLNIIFTGKLLEPMTLLNLNHYTNIGIKNIIISASVFVLACAFWWLPYLKMKKELFCFNETRLQKISKYILFVLLLILELVFKNSFPIHSAIRAVKKAYAQRSYVITYNDGNEFKKDNVYDNISNINTQNKNIILIFVEGLSSKVISPELTPNIYNLREDGLSFDNYFNHTAATYRGIEGQLTSGFRLLAGAQKINKISSIKETLPTILGKEGYDTSFISPHTGEFNDFIKAIGFTNIISGEKNDLSDEAMYNKLFEYLNTKNVNKKFFIATYLQGTHLGLDSPDKKYKNGDNEYLNKFYNHDYHFGQFVEKFKKSKYFDNTILVFTTDHASYPTSEFIKTFDTKSEIFADRIPLIIYDKYIKPSTIDAKYSNSLRLTPTLLQLLGINVQNHFLGNSLLDNKEISKAEKLFVVGFECYLNTEGSYRTINFINDCDIVKRFYDYYESK